MSLVVVGGAGFIGVNLVREFLHRDPGEYVVVIDNLTRGTHSNIENYCDISRVKFVQCNVDICDDLRGAMSEINATSPIREVWHLAANSDIPAGVSNPDIDFRDTFLTTYNLLRVMEDLGIGCLCFASTSAVYGDLGDIALSESAGPLMPISNYGAMKLASEGLISAACERFLKKALIFRFPNVVGAPATHGALYDFVVQLKSDPRSLRVLGDGSQCKGYLHVSDVVSAMIYLAEVSKVKIDLFNIGPEGDGVTVRFMAEEVVRQLSPDAKILFGEGSRGWVGDVPKFRYSIDKLKSTGWVPKMTSAQAVVRSVDEIIRQPD